MFTGDEVYINIHDNQGTGWALGRIGSLEDWRNQAMDWADSDDLDEVYVTLRDMRKDEVLDYINDIWDIQIRDIRELTAEDFEYIKDSIHLI